MALPDLIEIIPLEKPAHAEITVPGSKSITNRALILAALAGGKTILRGALWSEDTQVMVEALRQLGFGLEVEADRDEFSNRTISIKGLGGKIPKAGSEAQPLEIFVGNAGTAARFLTAFVCLGQGVYRLQGVPRMHERPQAALFSALRQLGYRIEASDDRLPATIYGTGPHAGECKVSIDESSQFASALILSARAGGWRVKVVGSNSEESPYVRMTSRMDEMFPRNGGVFDIEPDASSGSYFWAAGFLLGLLDPKNYAQQPPPLDIVRNWPTPEFQVDASFPAYLMPRFHLAGRQNFEQGLAQMQRKETGIISREHDLGDSIMTAIAIAPFRDKPWQFVELGRLRLQECERVAALRTELTKCGAKVTETGDRLEVFPGPQHGAEIETYDDHRMAMCFATLGLKVPGIRIRNPGCVRKTFPDFFQKLAGAPPHGLGATLLDAGTRRKLGLDELFAE